MLTAEDEYAVEYFANSFSLASSFLDNMSHQIAFGSIYEELIPLGLAKKKKNEDEVGALNYDRFDCNGELNEAASESSISNIDHVEKGAFFSERMIKKYKKTP